MLPGALGAYPWQAMAFNPETGLVYIPAQEIGMVYDPVKDFQTAPIGWNIGTATTFKANYIPRGLKGSDQNDDSHLDPS